MENQSISAHIVVVNQNNVKSTESKANSAPEGGATADFANLLAAQIQGERQFSVVTVPSNPDAALLEEKDKAAQDAPVAVLSEPQSETTNPLIVNLNLLPLAQLQSTQHEAAKPNANANNEALSLATDLGGNTKLTPSTTGLDKAANEITAAAKFAAIDKTLPPEALHDFKVESSNLGTLTPGSLASLNRASPPVPTGSPLPTTLATVAVPVGHAGWDTAFSQRVAWVATSTQQVAQLHLNPPNLGPLEIRISLSSDQANAAFTSPHAAVRDAIEAALPRLREMLADNGLSLGNVNVSSESFQQQQAPSGQNDSPRHDPFRELQRIAASASNTAVTAQGVAHIASGDKGLVDIFA